MRNISYDNITETVVRAYSGGGDAAAPRFYGGRPPERVAEVGKIS